MPRTTLAVQDTVTAGLTPTYTSFDNANGMQFANDGNIIVHMKNPSASQRIVTFLTPAVLEGVAVADPTYTLPATTGDKVTKLLAPAVYNQSDGNVYLDCDGAGVTIAAIRVNT